MEKVWHEWRLDRCQRNAKRDGYCTQHHPYAVEKRKLKREAEFKKQQYNTPWARLGRADERLKEAESLMIEVAHHLQRPQMGQDNNEFAARMLAWTEKL